MRLIQVISEELDREFPDAKCALHHEGPEQLLFATILSAQCTDERVNMVTPALFKKYPSSKELAHAELSEVEEILKSINFFRNKAKNLIAAAKIIQEKYPGGLPQTIEALTELPGVGRKTANVVLGDAFGLPLGITVDTHVRRLTQLIGLSTEEDPVGIEAELMGYVPKEFWTKLSHWLILHGRKTCIARRPKCTECVILKICSYGKTAVAEDRA
ncbi:MAG: endonuclease III [Proteobacteria bacterium]|nr:MAG: endonuclease III [Pseudomonadota bacterium]